MHFFFGFCFCELQRGHHIDGVKLCAPWGDKGPGRQDQGLAAGLFDIFFFIFFYNCGRFLTFSFPPPLPLQFFLGWGCLRFLRVPKNRELGEREWGNGNRLDMEILYILYTTLLTLPTYFGARGRGGVKGGGEVYLIFLFFILFFF